jgi:D-alanine--D-alanine ligase
MRKASEIETAFSPTDALDRHRSFFLVGIGGAGMSALARMLSHREFSVRGTDSTAGPETGRLSEEGIDVQIGHSGEGLTGDDVLVVTDAIDLYASPEVARAHELGIPIVRRSQALGWVLKPYKTICVTGTHGKTTTTGMIGAGLIAAGLDPTVVVGAAIPQWGGPVREGQGEWAVVEACEAYDSFHDLRPDIVVLTNLELDHVDFHGTWENLRDSVARFVNRLPEDGVLVYCAEDAGAAEIAAQVKRRVIGYKALEGVTLATPGQHNLLNGAGAVAACVEAGAEEGLARNGVVAFNGAERRLQILHLGPVTVVDDYAHHPTEIAASLEGLRARGMAFQAMGSTAFQAVSGKQGLEAPATHGLEGHVTIVKRQGANLPHWTKEGGTYSVVFRLADSVPKVVQEAWRIEREEFERAKAATLTIRDRIDYLRLRRQEVDDFLDSGHGSCVLADPRAAGIVADAIRHFQGERYQLHAWCVMPNHVHAVLTPEPGFELAEILHSWKSFTSNQINRLLERSGQLWQTEPYDHLVRDGAGLERCVQYVAENPVKAHLKDWPWVWRQEHAMVFPPVSGEQGQDAPGTHGLEAHATGRLIVVYQPHLYSRTAPLIDEFAAALSHADIVVLTDIYPAREAPMAGVSSARIAEKVTVPVRYVPSRHLLPREVAKIVRPGDVVVGMGAGNIAEFGPAFVKELARTEGPKKVAVLYGGDSAEREVSLHSGRAVADALKGKGYQVSLLDVSEVLLAKGDLSALIGANRPDVCFLAVHGTNAEDGAIQGLLHLLHLPYTGSSIAASTVAMDKAATKQVLTQHGIRVPYGKRVTNPDEKIDFPGPWVVKPNAQGSTVGLSFVEDPEALEWAIARALAYDDAVLVEEWIRGVEISTPVLVGEALPTVEISPKGEHYDFANKYLPGATDEIIPARLRPEVLEEAKRIAVAAHKALGCSGATRTDAIVRDPDGVAEIVALEVNTLPGMTATSLLPNSAAAAGIPFDDLCERLVVEAMKRNAPAD